MSMEVKRIGEAAGAVWARLRKSDKNGVALGDLKKVPGYTPDEALAGIGWLAREGKLSVTTAGKKMVFTLVEEEMFV
jgi:hypothetical protein